MQSRFEIATDTTSPKNVLYHKALLEYDFGNYDDARSLLESLVLDGDLDSDASPVSAELIAASLLLLGNIHATKGDITLCDERYREAFEILTIEYPSGHLGKATILTNHSAVLIRRWDILQHQHRGCGHPPPKTLIYESLRMLFAAHEMLANALGINRIILADCCHNTGMCLEIIGHPVDALEYYMKSLKIRCRVKESNADISQLCIAQTAENIAMIYRQMAGTKEDPSNPYLQKAEFILSRVVEIRNRNLGPMSGGSAEALFNLGLVNASRNNLQAARMNFSNCARVRSKLLGSDHELSKLAHALSKR